MVRRTKLDTEQTRRSILDAARSTFLERGLMGTTLEDVAGAAGVTRGAIYWHFANKKALFDAMRGEVCVPTIDRTDVTMLAAGATSGDPLDAIERFLTDLITGVTRCPATRETFEIMAFKCEYVGDFEKELGEHRRKSVEMRDVLAGVYRRARAAGALRSGLPPAVAAAATLVFMMGLLRMWLLDTESSLVRPHVKSLIAAHVDAMRKHAA